MSKGQGQTAGLMIVARCETVVSQTGSVFKWNSVSDNHYLGLISIPVVYLIVVSILHCDFSWVHKDVQQSRYHQKKSISRTNKGTERRKSPGQAKAWCSYSYPSKSIVLH